MENEKCISVPTEPKCTPRFGAPGDASKSGGDPAGLDRAMAALAGRQHGVVARWQLTQLGMSPGRVSGRIDRGGLQRVHHGVFAVGHSALTVHGRWMAAVLAFGPDAVLSHRSAGQLWGIMPRRAIEPEVTRPGFARGRPGIRVHHSPLSADEVIEVLGIPVTSVPRTLLDLAALVTPRQLERAWNEVEVRQLWDRLTVATVLERHPNRRGAAALRTLIDDARPVGITRNELEEGFLALVDRFGLPRPRLNAHLALRGKFYEVDCLWEAQRVVVELDARAVHGTDAAFESDRERDRILIAEGFRVPRVTYWQMRDTPAEVAADLRQILGTPYP